MLADDLVGGIALEPLRTRVPGRDMTFAIQQVDRVILDRVDQQLETAKPVEIVEASFLTHTLVHHHLPRGEPHITRSRIPPGFRNLAQCAAG
jgi:hypothetical protein